MFCHLLLFAFFFFTHTAPTEIYTLSLHDALPILIGDVAGLGGGRIVHVADEQVAEFFVDQARAVGREVEADIFVKNSDRKSTRLNSSHRCISYAVFCLKKKKINNT